MHFIVGNLTEIDKLLEAEQSGYDVILFSELMWFILPELKGILSKLKKVFSGKYIMINQTFYTAGQRYGREYFTNLNEMIDYLNIDVLGFTTAEMGNKSGSYETHSIFRI